MALFGDPDDRLRCALCGRPRREVVKLVAGQAGAACSDCIPYAVAAADGPDSTATLYRAVEHVLRGYNPLAPLERSGALVEAALALAAGDADACRAIALAAFRLHHYAAGLRALERIPHGARRPTDAINEAFAYYHLGRPARGLQALSAVDAAALGAEDRAFHLLNRAALELRAGELAPPQLADLRSRVEEAAMLFKMLPADAAERVRACLAACDSTLAECALKENQPDRAVALLRRIPEDALDAFARLLLGDALAAQGDGGAAHDCWRRAFKDAHPQSEVAAAARQRLTGIYR